MDVMELDIADAVETALGKETRVLGRRTHRDARDGSGIRVDFTYDSCSPPVALEVTSVQDESFLEAHSAARRLAEDLTAHAGLEGLTHYRVTIRSSAFVKHAKPILLDLMRRGESMPRDNYTSDDLMRWDADGSRAAHLSRMRSLAQAGVAEAVPAPGDSGTSVSTWGESGERVPLEGIEWEIAANLPKLIEAGSEYERHLAIGVGRFGVTQIAAKTPVPALPVDLHRLWLVHLWTAMDRSMPVWSIVQGDPRWRIHEPFTPMHR
jgi:hypothetical protein